MNLILPVAIDNSPPTCPHCKQNENTKTVCVNCGYEYKDEEMPTPVLILFWLILIGAIVGGFVGYFKLGDVYSSTPIAYVVLGALMGGLSVFLGSIICLGIIGLLSETINRITHIKSNNK